MNKSIASLAALLAAFAFTNVASAADVAAPETPGTAKPKAAAEAKHLAKKHGGVGAKGAEAEAPGSTKAQSAAEAKHLKKKHGNVNDTADKRLDLGHPNH